MRTTCFVAAQGFVLFTALNAVLSCHRTASAPSADALALKVTPIFTQTEGQVPRLSRWNDELLVAENSEGESIGKGRIHRFDVSGDQPRELGVLDVGPGAILRMASTPSWLAVCSETGNRARLFSRSQMAAQDLGVDINQGCFGVDVDEVTALAPRVLVGAPGTRRVLEWERGTFRVAAENVSGPSLFQRHGNFLFGIVGAINPAMQHPYVYDLERGVFLMGGASNTPLPPVARAGFADTMIDDSGVTGNILFLNRDAGHVVGISARQPAGSLSQDFRLAKGNARDFARYGQCLAVLHSGVSDSGVETSLEVVEARAKGSWQTIRVTSNLQKELGFRSALSVSSGGDAFLSGQEGVHRVRGLFDGLSCGSK